MHKSIMKATIINTQLFLFFKHKKDYQTIQYTECEQDLHVSTFTDIICKPTFNRFTISHCTIDQAVL